MKKQFILILFFLITIFYEQSTSLPTVLNDKTGIRKHCPYLVKCMSPCPYGYIIDDLGCQTCECNPCQLGLPLNEYPCEEGQSTCSNSKGICTVTAEGNTYCCPTEKSGSCPPSPDPSVVLCLPSNCNNDADCPAREKCCDPCFRCLNVTRS